jgi:four helix bundle protein
MSADRVENLRAWQLTYKFKLAIYGLLRVGPIARDFKLRDQLRDAAASAVSQIEEGFARFYPKDFGRLVVGAKASLLECCGHLRDAVDRGHITPEASHEMDALARDALHEIGGLLDYLQSPEAERNARRIKERRAERRQRRKNPPNEEPRTPNPEPRTEPPNKNREPGTGNEEPV